jgi:N-acetylmuramoyl-L-alanine amidase
LWGQTSDKKKFVAVLDAGHGGHDSGNRGNGYFEKNIALSIALGVGKILEKDEGIRVIYTRKSDKFVKLVDRANIANKADADLFVSIHCDAFTSSKAFGAGTFVLGLHENQRNFEIAKRENSVIFYEEDYEKNYEGFDPNNPESVISLTLMQETYSNQSIEAAATIQKSFVTNLGRKDRTVKQAGFVVLKYTYMPSVLVETGFLTNSREGAYLNSTKGKTDMSNAIAKAIVNYKNELEKGVVSLQVYENNKAVQLQEDHSNIYFRVQLAASKKAIDTRPQNFKGLEKVSLQKEGGYYKYYYGNSKSYKMIQKEQIKARRAGFKSAFIVSFKGNEKIKLSEALDALNSFRSAKKP